MLELYRKMYLIRKFEEACAENYTKGHIRGFLHLYIGQEATGVGAVAAIEAKDYIVTHYRDHGHALARGLDVNRTMAELFGKRTGLSKGKGGSMHLFDAGLRFMGGHAIVGGHFPLAAGLALSQQYNNEKGITVVFFGDGAVNQGTYHETMNLAGIWNLPLLFFLENNEYGMGSAVHRVHSAKGDFSKSPTAYNIKYDRVDGMDVIAVKRATQKAIEYIKAEKAPYFLEAKTYRFQGHSLADGEKYRSSEEVSQKRKLDPIETFKTSLTVQRIADQKQLENIRNEVDKIVNDSVEFALKSPEPDTNELFDDILVQNH